MEDELPKSDKSTLTVVKTGAEGDAPPPAPTPTPEAETLPAVTLSDLAVAPTDLPSIHQDHALNFINSVKLQYDMFKAQYDQVATELEGTDKTFAADRSEREFQFQTEQNRRDEEHDKARNSMMKMLGNLDVAMRSAVRAIEGYNELMKTGEEQQ